MPHPEALATLRGKWVRGWPKDAKPEKQKAIDKAWTAAIARGARPEAILAGADKHIAAADGLRFLSPLPEWLDTESWKEDPPPKEEKAKGGNRNGHWSRRRGGRRGNGLNPREEIIEAVKRRMAQ